MWRSICKLAACLSILVWMSGCESSLKLTREGKSLRTPVRTILLRDFGSQSGLEVPSGVVKGVTDACTQSLGKDTSIGGIVVTTDQSQCSPDSSIEVRGEFTAYNRRVWVVESIGDPRGFQDARETTVDVSAEVHIHDFKRGVLLASKTIGGEFSLSTPSSQGGRLVMVPLSEEEAHRRLSRGLANKVKDVVLAYLRTTKRG